MAIPGTRVHTNITLSQKRLEIQAPMYVHVYVRTYHIWYVRVRTYVRTCVRTYVHVYHAALQLASSYHLVWHSTIGTSGS